VVKEARAAPNRRVEPTDTERVLLRDGLGADGVVGEGVLAAPYRQLTRGPLGSGFKANLPETECLSRALPEYVSGFRRP